MVQDSFGQFHVRGEHAGLQYRINGVILPEGIAVFGQTLDPRLISSISLVTGALPAEYGLRTAGIIDITTKSGVQAPGGFVSVYGGSHGEIQPSLAYGGGAGPFSYFVTGDFLRNDLGIESPDGSSNPIHDHTTQYHGFGYFEYILNDENRVALMLGSSVGKFQIPNLYGEEPALGLTGRRCVDVPQSGLEREPTRGHSVRRHELAAFRRRSRRAVLVHRALFELDLHPGFPRGPLVHRRLPVRLQTERGLCAAKRRRLQARRRAHAARRHLSADRSFDQRHRLPGAAGRPDRARRFRHRAGDHHRQRDGDRVDLQRLPPGRMEAAARSHRQLRPALRQVHRLYGGQTGEPAVERGMAGARGDDRPCRLFTLPVAAALRTGRRQGRDAVRGHLLPAAVAERFASAGRARELLRRRRATEGDAPAYDRLGYLLQTVHQLGRRRTVRRAHHLDAVQLSLRQAIRGRAHDELHHAGISTRT